MSENKSGDTLVGFLLGATVGAVAALLLAPRTGAQTRRRITDWLEENRERTGEVIEKGREKLHQAKERVQSAAEAARAAYNDSERA